MPLEMVFLRAQNWSGLENLLLKHETAVKANLVQFLFLDQFLDGKRRMRLGDAGSCDGNHEFSGHIVSTRCEPCKAIRS